jgi:hypothetical protein
MHNLDEIHKHHVIWGEDGTPPKRGFSIMIDEIALEERPRYDGSHDALLGIAREDASSCDLYNITLDSLHEITDCIANKSLTAAKEATVISLAAFGKDNYNPVPIVISGMSKKEQERQQAKLIKLTVNAFLDSPVGACIYGELDSVSSDGDAVRRKALHKLFMQDALSEQLSRVMSGGGSYRKNIGILSEMSEMIGGH